MTISNSLPRQDPSEARAKGFTLIEILLSVSLLVFIIVILGTITSHIGRMWTEVNAQNQRRSTGRALLQFIARDLQSVRLPNPAHPADGNTFGRPQFIASPDGFSYLNLHALFWQASVAATGTNGCMAEVGYFVKWNGTKACLCRFYADPTKMDTANKSLYLIYSDPANWYSNTTVDADAPATKATLYQGCLADNVIAFFARCVNESGQPIIQDTAHKYGFNSLNGYKDPTTQITFPGPILPPAVEIALVVVDANTAQKISTAPTATSTDPANFYSDIQTFVSSLPKNIQSGTEIFSTTVFLPRPAK